MKKKSKGNRVVSWMLLLSLLLSLLVLGGCSSQGSQSSDDGQTAAPNSGETTPEAEQEQDEARAVVEAPTGTYLGNYSDGVESYLGVRYAAPVENFKAPEDVTTTTDDEIDATQFGPACLQPYDPSMEPSLGETSSDCLTLNIWTKDSDTKGKPVMLFIHGGSFVAGGGNDSAMNGTNFLNNLGEDEDAVMITINHRLGILGQIDMSLLDGYSDEYADCNNLWLLDVIQSLKWVNENIEAFGGDPNNVTIYGQSSGGMVCFYLCTVPEARPYFDKVIIQSGAPFYGLTDKENYQRNSQIAFDELGVTSVEEFVALSDEQINEKLAEIEYIKGDLSPRYIDGRVIPLTWWDDFRNGAAKDIDILIGATDGEVDFSLYDPENYPATLSKDAIMEKLYARYGSMGTPTYALIPNGNQEVINELLEARGNTDMAAVDIFGYFCHQLANSYVSEAQGQYNNVYAYNFTWCPDIHAAMEGLPENAAFTPTGRSPHCAEIPILFDTCAEGYPYLAMWWASAFGDSVRDKYDTTDVPTELIAQMQKTWYTFAKTGDPNNDLIPEWKPYTQEEPNVMNMGADKWECVDDFLKDDFEILSAIRPLGEQ